MNVEHTLSELEMLGNELRRAAEDLATDGKASTWLEVAEGRIRTIRSLIAGPSAMPTTTKDEAARTPGQAETVTILYTNYRGETAVRRITPIAREWFGASEWHPEPQWLFTAFDMDKEAFRDFARSGVKAWGQAAVDAALSAPASPGVPDSLRALSEKASPGRFEVIRGLHHYIVVAEARDQKGLLNSADADFAAASANYVRDILSSHLAGQSAGSGAEDWRERAASEIDTIAEGWEADGRAYAKTLAAILRSEQPIPGSRRPNPNTGARRRPPAPYSTRTVAEGTEWVLAPLDDDAADHADSRLPLAMIEAGHDAYVRVQEDLKNYVAGETPDWDAGMAAVAVYRAMLAARPEAPEAQGAETFETIAKWCEDTFGPIEPARIVSRAAEEMEELKAEPTRVEEAADVVIVLSRYPGLWETVERKMAVNRKRRWRLMGDGTGYHIKDEPAPPSSSGQGGR